MVPWGWYASGSIEFKLAVRFVKEWAPSCRGRKQALVTRLNLCWLFRWLLALCQIVCRPVLLLCGKTGKRIRHFVRIDKNQQQPHCTFSFVTFTTVHLFICPFIHSFVHYLIYSLLHSLILSFEYLFIDRLLAHFFIGSFVHSFFCSFIPSFALFIHSFTFLFI